MVPVLRQTCVPIMDLPDQRMKALAEIVDLDDVTDPGAQDSIGIIGDREPPMSGRRVSSKQHETIPS